MLAAVYETSILYLHFMINYLKTIQNMDRIEATFFNRLRKDEMSCIGVFTYTLAHNAVGKGLESFTF